MDIEKQTKGLKSFASHVERFLAEQHTQGGGATAPDVNAGQERRRSSRERQEVTTEHTSGASSSSARQLHYVQIPEPPSVPAPPVPSEAPPPSDAQPTRATHFSTLRSEVRAGAIRVDISNSEQWSPGKTAILRDQEAKQVRI